MRVFAPLRLDTIGRVGGATLMLGGFTAGALTLGSGAASPSAAMQRSPAPVESSRSPDVATLATTAKKALGPSDSRLLSYVNESIGSSNWGNTSEAAAAPFGMIEFGPQSVHPYEANFIPGQPIAGLSLTNVDGTGCPLFGDVPLLPVSGGVGSHPGSLASAFTTTSAEPGTWAGTVGAVVVHASATTRTAIAALQFPGGKAARLVVKAGDSATSNTGADVQVTSSSEVVGSASAKGFCGSPSHYTVYFAIESSTPFVNSSTYLAHGPGAGAVVSFGTPASGFTVTVKVGISYVSIADARANIAAEDPAWSVTAVRDATALEWAQLLSRVQVQGGSPAKIAVLYSALYHALLAPETFSDANGKYLGFDGVVHTLPAGATQFSEFSGWDIQISEFPLLCLVVPGRAAEMAQSLVRDEQEGGWLPRWPVAASYSGVMEGDPADAILAEAVAFGCTTGLDLPAAAQAVIKGATVAQSPSSLGQGTYWERYYGPDYNSYGYAPGQASETLQLSMDDYAAAQVASAAGLSSEARTLLGYSGNWVSTFDTKVGLPEPRNYPAPYGDGSFQSTAAVATPQQWCQPGFDEGNASEYVWFVPEHLGQLAQILGGDARASAKLTRFLEPMIRTGLDATWQQPYYEASDEQDLWAPWEGDFFGDPVLTERATSAALFHFYTDSANGIPTNDDAGEMSSWAFWAMIGLFPMTPGSTTMAVGSPEFTSVTLGAGHHMITVSAPGAGPSAPYVAATLLDGRGPLGRPDFQLATGRTTLELKMSATAVYDAFSSRILVGQG